MSKIFKISNNVNGVDQLAEILKSKLGNKYKLEVKKSGNGVTKFLTGNTSDTINIKKNAYHGVIVTVSEKTPELDYMVVGIGGYTPSTILHQVLGKTGIIDMLIGKAIWGSGKQFYSEIDETIVKELDGKEVDNSILNNAKQMFKGKSVLDE